MRGIFLICKKNNNIITQNTHIPLMYGNKNEYNDRRVLYPKIWFGPAANIDTKDLCPPDWVKINYNY